MKKFTQATAVVTGAASGIGRELAIQLAKRGTNLAISDVNNAGLEETASLIMPQAPKVHTQLLDVSDKEAVLNYADLVQEEFGTVNLVINNAGVALNSGDFSHTSLDEFEWLMGINFFGVLYGCKAFLPYLKQADWGHIVNISSLFGLIGVPGQSAYNASKFAVRGLTESLRQELEATGSSVSCTSVHPGGVKTNIARDARAGAAVEDSTHESKPNFTMSADQFNRMAKTTASSAAAQILKAVVKNKRRLLIGRDAKTLDLIQRFSPDDYHKAVMFGLSKMKR